MGPVRQHPSAVRPFVVRADVSSGHDPVSLRPRPQDRTRAEHPDSHLPLVEPRRAGIAVDGVTRALGVRQQPSADGKGEDSQSGDDSDDPGRGPQGRPASDQHGDRRYGETDPCRPGPRPGDSDHTPEGGNGGGAPPPLIDRVVEHDADAQRYEQRSGGGKIRGRAERSSKSVRRAADVDRRPTEALEHRP